MDDFLLDALNEDPITMRGCNSHEVKTALILSGIVFLIVLLLICFSGILSFFFAAIPALVFGGVTFLIFTAFFKKIKRNKEPGFFKQAQQDTLEKFNIKKTGIISRSGSWSLEKKV